MCKRTLPNERVAAAAMSKEGSQVLVKARPVTGAVKRKDCEEYMPFPTEQMNLLSSYVTHCPKCML